MRIPFTCFSLLSRLHFSSRDLSHNKFTALGDDLRKLLTGKHTWTYLCVSLLSLVSSLTHMNIGIWASITSAPSFLPGCLFTSAQRNSTSTTTVLPTSFPIGVPTMIILAPLYDPTVSVRLASVRISYPTQISSVLNFPQKPRMYHRQYPICKAFPHSTKNSFLPFLFPTSQRTKGPAQTWRDPELSVATRASEPKWQHITSQRSSPTRRSCRDRHQRSCHFRHPDEHPSQLRILSVQGRRQQFLPTHQLRGGAIQWGLLLLRHHLRQLLLQLHLCNIPEAVYERHGIAELLVIPLASFPPNHRRDRNQLLSAGS